MRSKTGTDLAALSPHGDRAARSICSCSLVEGCADHLYGRSSRASTAGGIRVAGGDVLDAPFDPAEAEVESRRVADRGDYLVTIRSF
jgi:hypothetical protein